MRRRSHARAVPKRVIRPEEMALLGDIHADVQAIGAMLEETDGEEEEDPEANP